MTNIQKHNHTQTRKINPKVFTDLKSWFVPFSMLAVLLLANYFNFLLFHSLAEIFAIIVAILLAVVAWQMYPFTRNAFLMYLGCGYFWIGGLDLVHMMTYPGINIYDVDTPNTSSQFWINTRYIEAILLLTAPWFLNHNINRGLVMAGFGLISTLFYTLVIMDIYPDTYIQNQGLTPFKIISEYIIIGLLVIAMLYLWHKRRLLDHRILTIMIASISLTICAELSFTFYFKIHDLPNILGHVFKLFSFWLIFMGMIKTSLQEPFLAMSRGASTYDAIPDATIVTDQKGFIRQVNQAACTLAGLSADKLINTDSHEIFHIRSIDKEVCPVCMQLKTESTIPHIELNNQDTHRFYHCSLSPVTRFAESQGIVQMIRDVTEKRLTENALQHAQKMDVLGKISGGLAHDFNNQLGIIRGYLELASDSINHDSELKKWLETSLKSTQRCVDLTRQLLTFSRKSLTQRSIADINSKIREMEGMISRTVTPAINVTYKLAPDLWYADIDSGEFIDAILNLVINARDAMPNGGELLIETNNKYLSDDYTPAFPVKISGEYVQILISDTGIGMDKQTMDSIFEPFFTTKAEGEGTGLGLAMVYGFARHNNGNIHIYSEPGEGSTFQIYLPRAKISDEQDIQTETKTTTLYHSNASILIVDDEEALLELAEIFLNELGYNTYTAEDAEQALDVLRQNPEIELLFSDVVMPGGMSGYDLANKAKELRPNLRILLTSGFTKKNIDTSGIRLQLLGKPYTKQELSDALQLLIKN